MSELKSVIASRELTCLIDGHRNEGQVRLGEPYAENGAYKCAYEIVIGNDSTVLGIQEVDGIQALRLAHLWSAQHCVS